jgi:diguanylate cyclase (GGDEF)-like protein/PAS domain S-box-containing protein
LFILPDDPVESGGDPSMRSISAFFQRLRSGKAGGHPRADFAPNFRLLAEHSSDIVMEVGTDRLTAYVSPSCTRLLGWLPEELIGRGPDAFILPEYIPAIEADVAALNAGARDEGTLVLQLRKKDGGSLWVEGKARIVRTDEMGGAGELVAVFRDISERKKLEDHLAMAAVTDGLTGIFNRRAFDERLEREWTNTVRRGGQIALLLIDIDRFKDFNDTYGHHAGDDCLRVVARAARKALQDPEGMIARYGGEEFAAILPDFDLSRAVDTAEQVRHAVWTAKIPHLKNRDGRGRVTVSIGTATALSRAGGTIRMPEGLLLAADGALYKAKHNGRNRVEAALLLAPEGSTAAA